VKILGAVFGLALLVAGFVFFFIAAPRVDSRLNVVTPHEPYVISAEARRLHGSLRVADLHVDTLLWARDPLKRHVRGQADLPRLREGGVRLQVFASVTKTPSRLNYDENDARSDDITLLMVAQRWPVKTWTSLAERALYQAARLEKLEQRAGGDFRFVRTAGALREVLSSAALAGLMATEGAHSLEGDIANLERLHDAGYRIVGLHHFFDNELGGSLHGTSGEGLTDFGRQVVAGADAKSMIIDVAHSSEKTVRDVLAMSTRPLIVSHTGLKGRCDTARNISDVLMKEIADGGGLIGVGFWAGAVCDTSPQNIAGAIVYAVELLGVEHVALGSDFDGAITAAFDASELAVLTGALLEAGMDAENIRLVMGENAIRFFLENLPD